MTRTVSRALQPLCTSTALGKDWIPRLSVAAFERMRDDMVRPHAPPPWDEKQPCAGVLYSSLYKAQCPIRFDKTDSFRLHCAAADDSNMTGPDADEGLGKSSCPPCCR